MLGAVVAATGSSVGCSSHGELVAPLAAAPDGWEVTVYYTAVEHFHDGPPRRVTGCVVLDCVDGRDHIGYYPSDFVDAVEFEGSGRLETGRYAGSYLNWAHDVGFWVDDVPRDSSGGVLVPFVSAAADPGVLAQGTAFQVVACGMAEDGNAIPPAVCEKFSSPHWTISDEFTPGFGGERRVALYVGDETSSTFTDGPLYTKLLGAELTVAGTLGPADPGPFGTAPSTSTTTSPAATRPTVGTTAGTGPPLVP